MTETADGSPEHSFERSEAQKYFHAVEDIFTGLRGAPLLLAPADWRVAKRWYEAGVPLEIVRDTLRELTTRRHERDPEARINSLRYFDRAVQGAWTALRESRGPSFGAGGGVADDSDSLDIPARLTSLAESLPPDLPDRDQWAGRIREVTGSPRAVEEALSSLDDALLDAAERRLAPPARRDLEEAVERAVRRAGTGHGSRELQALRTRLFRRELRTRVGLPLLTLF